MFSVLFSKYTFNAWCVRTMAIPCVIEWAKCCAAMEVILSSKWVCLFIYKTEHMMQVV